MRSWIKGGAAGFLAVPPAHGQTGAADELIWIVAFMIVFLVFITAYKRG